MEKLNPDNLIADDFGKPLDPNAHRDVITGAPHSHPIGTGVGAAIGATAGGILAGAAIGAGLSGPAAPIGGVVGAVVAALVGGAAGHAISEHYEDESEDLYWRENYRMLPYYSPELNYPEYGPAFRYGWISARSFQGLDFDEMEMDLARDWNQHKGLSNLSWEKARNPARDAWNRVRSRAAADTKLDQKSNPDRPAVLTTDDVVRTPDIRTPEPEIHTPDDAVRTPTSATPGSGPEDVGDVSRTNPDLFPTITRSDERMMDNPDVHDRPVKRAIVDPAD